MRTNTELIEHLRRTGVLHSPALIESFTAVDRKDFVRPEHLPQAYEDYPLPIGYGQTISQPFTVAFMLELLELRPDDTVLDIGSGSGWTTALIAVIAKKVWGVERIPELAAFARANLSKYHFENAAIETATSQLGIPGRTFDKILVSASALDLPNTLIEQLNPGGILVIPVRDSIFQIKKQLDKTITENEHYGFVFVPLIY
jgi:protein-L-isoaspartate(D-aspartate) O-methyltransferase